MSTSRREQTRAKVRAYRNRLRSQGLRPIQIWVPDTRSSSFMAEARRQSMLARNSPHAGDDQRFIESITDSELE